jgi:hypothetical protein
MNNNSFNAARPTIKDFFTNDAEKIFKRNDLHVILAANRSTWKLAKRMSAATFISNLLKARILVEYDLPFPHRPEKRFAGPTVPVAEILLSLKAGSYFSHISAAVVHGLTSSNDQIVVNFEQGEHIRNPLPEQSAIDGAFKARARLTKNWISTEHGIITMLNGMQTGELGVVNLHTTEICGQKSLIRVTDLERTLIDMTVRPHYSGGIEVIIEAFRAARARVDTVKLASYLERLRYVYPYHQAIGWYMTAANFEQHQIAPISSIPRLRNFYLINKIELPLFDQFWKITVPA